MEMDLGKVFTELVEEVQRAIVRMETNGKASPTVFEVETAIAFFIFSERGIVIM